ncbi:MAG: hypothetical protein R2848_05120 [Thermomicrobiales bacterium]
MSRVSRVGRCCRWVWIGLLLLAWEFWVRWRDTPQWYLPAPSAVWHALIDTGS